MRLSATYSRARNVVGLALALLLGWGALAGAQELARPGLDTPKIRVAVADFRAIGCDDAPAIELSDRLRRALSSHPQVQMIAGDEVRAALAEAEGDVLQLKEGASRALGDKLGVDAVVYGKIVADVNSLLDEPAALKQPLAQVLVAETFTLEGQLYPSPAIPLQEGADVVTELASAALALLPAPGRVLSIIESPQGVAIQLFPLGGRVLAAGAEYGVYDPVRFRVPIQDPTGRSEALARQDLRLGTLTGRVRTAPQPDDHAVTATSIDPAGRISVGQLVGLPPLTGSPRQPTRLPLLLVGAAPANSVVFLDGQVVGVTPVGVLLEAGKKSAVAIRRRDFEPATFEVTAGQADGLAMAVALREIEPLGTLSIATTPPGATASLDGKDLGRTPLTVTDLPAGEHRLAVTLDGFKPIAHALTIRREKTTELNFDLQRDVRRVRIVSKPEGARIFLDGDIVGTTPAVLAAVRTGEHELRLTLAGHATVKQIVTITTDEPERSLDFRLRALAGNLRIETTPPGAMVSIDGQDKGKTPIAITALPIGQHQMALNMEGYQPVAKTVEVQDQQTTVVQETLVQAQGSILCLSVPEGARITLDGRNCGVTPKTLENVPIGRRILTLSLEGYREWTARVPVIHGETTKVEVGLIREAQAGLRRTP